VCSQHHRNAAAKEGPSCWPEGPEAVANTDRREPRRVRTIDTLGLMIRDQYSGRWSGLGRCGSSCGSHWWGWWVEGLVFCVLVSAERSESRWRPQLDHSARCMGGLRGVLDGYVVETPE